MNPPFRAGDNWLAGATGENVGEIKKGDASCGDESEPEGDPNDWIGDEWFLNTLLHSINWIDSSLCCPFSGCPRTGSVWIELVCFFVLMEFSESSTTSVCPSQLALFSASIARSGDSMSSYLTNA